uniref:Uncharacterized protein n=1 Tax=Daphnia galeata TaxID=27404 RepID=A0A8J2RT70_9CRUS|nr:unnamed protein product [Daphnia galeata]
MAGLETGVKARHGISLSLRLFGEAGDVNISEVENLIQELCKLGRRKPKNDRGTNGLPAKDRATLVLYVNATGTCKMSCKVAPLIVGTSKKSALFWGCSQSHSLHQSTKCLGKKRSSFGTFYKCFGRSPSGKKELGFNPIRIYRKLLVSFGMLNSQMKFVLTESSSTKNGNNGYNGSFDTPDIKNDRDVEDVVSRWLDLERDPKILALDEIQLF